MKNVTIGATLILIMMFVLSGCSDDSVKETSKPDSSETAVQQEAPLSDTGEVAMEESYAPMQEEPAATELVMHIDRAPIEVAWENNDSVAALKELAKDAPIEIQMSMYGGFEQVGSLGADLPRNDVQTTTEAGDIVLYQGNQVVVFYGSNSWAYTRLGHIDQKSPEELAQLLGRQDVTLTLEMKGGF